jgi:hypothetical protein
MNPDAGPDAASPAEERLLRHLQALREHPPDPATALTDVVLRTARWQAAVRPFALAAGRLVGGMGDSARIMLGRAGR